MFEHISTIYYYKQTIRIVTKQTLNLKFSFFKSAYLSNKKQLKNYL